jgi:hypothetical protein
VLVLRASAHRQHKAFEAALQDLQAAREVYCKSQASAAEKAAQAAKAAEEARVAEAAKLKGLTEDDDRPWKTTPGDVEVVEEGGGGGGERAPESEKEAQAAAPEHPEITRQRTLTFNDMGVQCHERGELDAAVTLLDKVGCGL